MRLSTVFAIGMLTLTLAACGTQPVTGSASPAKAFDAKFFDVGSFFPSGTNTSTVSNALTQGASAMGGNNAAATNIGQGNVGSMQQTAQGLVPINVGTQTQGPNVSVNVVPQIGGIGSTGYTPDW